MKLGYYKLKLITEGFPYDLGFQMKNLKSECLFRYIRYKYKLMLIFN